MAVTQGKPVGMRASRQPPELRRPLRFSMALLMFAAFLSVATVGYYVIEKRYGWLDAFYMTVITVSTVGLAEVGGELSSGGRLWTVVVIAGGLISGAIVLSTVVAAVVEGRLRAVLGRRHLERRVAGLSGHLIVCGYGRVGQFITQRLRQAGREVVAVDSDPARTAQAEGDGVLYVLGDAQEETVLTSAGIARASSLVAVLPDDAGNVFLTLTARGLNGALAIIARAQEAGTEQKLRRAGATRVVCPQVIGASRIVEVVLRPAIVDFVEMAHKGVDLEMDEMTLRADSGMIGKTLRELSLPGRVGASVVAIRRADGTAVYNPGADVALSAGDTLVLIGKRGVVTASQALERGPAGVP